MTIAGEQDVPLENKQRVEIVKGIAGLESGVASAGGLINYVTKRPAIASTPWTWRQINAEHRTEPSNSASPASSAVGPALNLAGENMHTYVEGADGWRGMGAVDGRWGSEPQAQLSKPISNTSTKSSAPKRATNCWAEPRPAPRLSLRDARLSVMVEAQHL